MFPKFVFFGGVALLWSTVTGVAQTPTSPPPLDTAALLKELLTLQATQKQAKASQLDKMARQFQDASRTDGDAGRLYVESVRTVDFSSQMGDAKRFQDWRTRKKDFLDNKAFQAALRFHLRYLALTLEASAAAKSGELPPYQEVVTYVTDLAQARQVLSSGVRGEDQGDFQDLLSRPLSEGKIARAQGLKPDLEQFAGPGSKTWEPTAGNWPQILELDVRAPMRLAKNPKLLDTWQLQMKLAGDQLGSRDEMGKTNFAQVEVPKLRWGYARDLAVLGRDNDSLIEMVKLVRTYPQHPDFSSWVEQLTSILQEKAATAAAPAAQTPAGKL